MEKKSRCCNAEVETRYVDNLGDIAFCKKCNFTCELATDEGKETKCKGCGRISTVVDLYSSCPFCAAIPPESWREDFRSRFVTTFHKDEYRKDEFASCVYPYEVESFISQTLATEKSKIIKEIGEMKKELWYPKSFPKGKEGILDNETVVIALKNAREMRDNTYETGYNQALSDILALLSSSDSETLKNFNRDRQV